MEQNFPSKFLTKIVTRIWKACMSKSSSWLSPFICNLMHIIVSNEMKGSMLQSNKDNRIK